jgi:hypothetical protein
VGKLIKPSQEMNANVGWRSSLYQVEIVNRQVGGFPVDWKEENQIRRTVPEKTVSRIGEKAEWKVKKKI